VTVRVKKVRRRGEQAKKKLMLMEPSNLLLSRTRKTRRGMTRKL